jgi:hypothetical protein
MIYILLAYSVLLYVTPVTNSIRTLMEEIPSCKAFLGAQDCSCITVPATCCQAGSWWDWEDPVVLLTADLTAIFRSLGLYYILVLHL